MKRFGTTLLELLLVLGLLTSVFVLVVGMVRLYSKHYFLAENKVSRSQLVRSLAEILQRDLAGAIQDPIHTTDESQWIEGSYYVRRFGLRGTSQSLEVDVIEPNFFDRELLEPTDSARTRQVPELKTVIYQFVSPATLDDKESQWGNDNAVKPLTRKYGLSRQEVDFETPDTDSAGNNPLFDGSEIVGSLQAPPDWEKSPLHRIPGSTESPNSVASLPPLTAAQLAADVEEGVSWAPEVVNCRFRYYNGTSWVDQWNSIDQAGLPIAIEIRLHLLPLDDLDILRNSPEFLRFANRSASSGLMSNNDGSYFAGSLELPAESSKFTAAFTLNDVLDSLGLSLPTERRIISSLPTTPLAGHQVLQRREPGAVRSPNGSNAAAGSGRANRTPADRQFQERSATERVAADRQARSRESTTREATAREAGENLSAERTAGERQSRDRTATGRTARDRNFTDRQIAAPVIPPASEEPVTFPPIAELSSESPDFAIIDDAKNLFNEAETAMPNVAGPTPVEPATVTPLRPSAKPPTGEWIRGPKK